MYDQIKEFIDGLFIAVPQSPQADAYKQQLYSETVQRFDTFVAQGNTPQAAYSLAIAGIGDISGRLASFSVRTDAPQYSAPLYSPEQLEKDKKRSGILLTVSVMLYILCFIPLIVLDNTRFGDTVGLCLMFIMIAVATGIIIYRSQTKLHTDSVQQPAANSSRSNQSPAQKGIIEIMGLLTLVVYLGVSFLTSAWYITWLVFPIFAAINRVIMLCFEQHKSGNNETIAAFVVKIILLLAIASSLIGLLFASVVKGNISWEKVINWLPKISTVNYDETDGYAVGSGEVDVDNIDSLDINWINGKVDIRVTDGDKLTFSENGYDNDKDDQMRYLVKNNKLIIQFCKSGNAFLGAEAKSLTVGVPQKLAQSLHDIDLSVASSDAVIDGITCNSFDFETVSGELTATDCTFSRIDAESVSGKLSMQLTDRPSKIDAETVSGKIEVFMDECEGFSASIDTVSGAFYSGYECDSVGDNEVYGDGGSRFDFDTVSGDISVFKTVKNAE